MRRDDYPQVPDLCEKLLPFVRAGRELIEWHVQMSQRLTPRPILSPEKLADFKKSSWLRRDPWQDEAPASIQKLTELLDSMHTEMGMVEEMQVLSDTAHLERLLTAARELEEWLVEQQVAPEGS